MSVTQKIVNIASIMAVMIGLFSPLPVFADCTPSKDSQCCGKAETSLINCSNNPGTDVQSNPIWSILLIIINIMTAGVGILAVAGITYGAVLYTTAEDKANQVRQAIDIITNVVIGLVAFALMWALLNFIIPGGVFTT